MGSSAACLTLLLSLSLLLIPVYLSLTVEELKVGDIRLMPSHAVPGTFVTFEGDGWGTESLTDKRCIVYGTPVRGDLNAVCHVVLLEGIWQPSGTFVVAEVPAGTYSVSVVVNPAAGNSPSQPSNFVAEGKLTVDG